MGRRRNRFRANQLAKRKDLILKGWGRDLRYSQRGTAKIVVPDSATTQGRIKVEAVGNVFFALSNGDFQIHPTN
jgi:hypothetical protein